MKPRYRQSGLYPNNNNSATVGDATNLDLTLPPLVVADDPMQTFQLTAVAPSGAHYAGVRASRPPDDYAPLLVDDFVIMAEPTEVSLSIKKQGSNAKLSWPRSLKHRLEESSNPYSTNGWSVVDKPVKEFVRPSTWTTQWTNTVRFFLARAVRTRPSGPFFEKPAPPALIISLLCLPSWLRAFAPKGSSPVIVGILCDDTAAGRASRYCSSTFASLVRASAASSESFPGCLLIVQFLNERPIADTV